MGRYDRDREEEWPGHDPSAMPMWESPGSARAAWRYGGPYGPMPLQERPGGPHRGKGPKNYRRSDDRIFEDVCDRLSEHPALDATDLEIEVSEGIVTLKGLVHDRADKRLAEDLADPVNGVRDVMNQIRIRTG